MDDAAGPAHDTGEAGPSHMPANAAAAPPPPAAPAAADNEADPDVQVVVPNPQDLKPRKKRKEREDVDHITCPICYEPWTSTGPHRISSLRCGHLFGRMCIVKWFETGVKCPTCNQPARQRDVRPVFVARLSAIDTAERDAALTLAASAKKELAKMKKELEENKNGVLLLQGQLKEQDLVKHVEGLQQALANAKAQAAKVADAHNKQLSWLRSQLPPAGATAATAGVSGAEASAVAGQGALAQAPVQHADITVPADVRSTEAAAVPATAMELVSDTVPSSPPPQPAAPSSPKVVLSPQRGQFATPRVTSTSAVAGSPMPVSPAHLHTAAAVTPSSPHSSVAPATVGRTLFTRTASTLMPASGSGSVAPATPGASSVVGATALRAAVEYVSGNTLPHQLFVKREVKDSRAFTFASSVSAALLTHTAMTGSRPPSLPVGIRRVSLLNPAHSEWFGVHTKQIRDIKASQWHRNHVLTCGMDMSLCLSDLDVHSKVLSYELKAPAWSCAISPTSPHVVYVGLGSGDVVVYDIRVTGRPMNRLILSAGLPVHSLVAVRAADLLTGTGDTAIAAAAGVQDVLVAGASGGGVRLAVSPSAHSAAVDESGNTANADIAGKWGLHELALPMACTAVTHNSARREFLVSHRMPDGAQSRHAVFGLEGTSLDTLIGSTHQVLQTHHSMRMISRPAFFTCGPAWGQRTYVAACDEQTNSLELWDVDLASRLGTVVRHPSAILKAEYCHVTAGAHTRELLGVLSDTCFTVHSLGGVSGDPT